MGADGLILLFWTVLKEVNDADILYWYRHRCDRDCAWGSYGSCASGKATGNSASEVLYELRNADFRLDDKIIRDSLVRIVAKNGEQENDSYVIRRVAKPPSAIVVTRRCFVSRRDRSVDRQEEYRVV